MYIFMFCQLFLLALFSGHVLAETVSFLDVLSIVSIVFLDK